MDIRERILSHSQFVKSNADKVANEQDTKRVLVIPFLEDVLGIKSRDPHDLKSEYPADWGDRNHKAVDYALMFGDKPLVIIEAKMARKSLDGEPLTQLRGYFSAIPEAKFGILTDGIKYRFYADLDNSKGLDPEPFLEIDLSDAYESRVSDIARFQKDSFDANQILDWAKENSVRSKWQDTTTNLLRQELAEPSDEFVRFMMDRLDAGRKTRARRDDFRAYIKTSVSQLRLGGEKLPVPPEPPHPVEEWVSLSTFKPKLGDDPPEYIRFPGEEPRHLDSWRSLTVETANWLYETGKVQALGAPYRFGKTGAGVINTNKKNVSGNDMIAPHQIGNQHLYVEKNGNCVAQVNRVLALLDSLTSIDAATVHIQLSG